MNIFKTIKSKLIASLLVFAVIFIAIFAVSVLVSAGDEMDSTLLNIAGRQRLLSQKILKETIVYVTFPDSAMVKKETILSSMELFEKTGAALVNGGETFRLDMKSKVVLPAPKAEARAQFIEAQDSWFGFKRTLMGVINARQNDPQTIQKILNEGDKLLLILNGNARYFENDSQAKLARLIYLQLFGLTIFVIISMVLLVIINRSLGKPVANMVNVFEQVANGDLTSEIQTAGSDEISQLGTSFNKVLKNLGGIIRMVKNSTDQVNLSINEITASSSDLATRTNEEAASITQTSATLEELTAIVKQNKTNAEEIGFSLVSFNQEIQSRNELMINVTDTMQDIHESGKKIDAIVNVINDISFQTNLLALNAAVEAARAGEAGRGFAVVASEVRNLAQKTAESSKTIQSIVSQNVESTERGMELVRQTADFFSTIMKVMQDIVNRIEQITDSSRQQASGVEQINTAVAQLENVINQNAALVEELSSTTKGMRANYTELGKLVGQFTLAKEVDVASQKTTRRTMSSSSISLDFQKKPASAKAAQSMTVTPSAPKPSVTVSNPKKAASKAKATEDDFFGMNEDEFEEF
ncbi:MAG: methyl-accepting chemotaxis protein [Candidatus Omnitrophota bacterium]